MTPYPWCTIFRNGTTIQIYKFKLIHMAKNGPIGGGRLGAVDNRIQYRNPQTNQYVKTNTTTHRFMDVKTSGGPFKGVRRGN